MKVYVLLRGFDMEGIADVVGVYSTPEKAAEAEAADREGLEGGGSYWRVEEHQVQ